MLVKNLNDRYLYDLLENEFIYFDNKTIKIWKRGFTFFCRPKYFINRDLNDPKKDDAVYLICG